MSGRWLEEEILREAYQKYAADGRITEHEVKKAVEHAGGGYISDHHAGRLLRSLAGWDGVVTQHVDQQGTLERSLLQRRSRWSHH